MKDYLNREERRIATFICVMYSIVENLLETNKHLSKDETTALKYAHTYLDKYITALIKRVGVEEGNRIYKLARDNKVELIQKQYDGQLLVDKNCMEEVARMAVETHCFGCKRTDWHNCELCKFMHTLKLGRICEDTNRCEFYYDEE